MPKKRKHCPGALKATARAQRVIKDFDEVSAATAHLRAQGINVDYAVVNVSPDAAGWTLTCGGCNATAKVPFDPGPKVGLCPDCARAGGML